ncbi:hypothetical protein F5Y07DRAFT_22307 [Xylaria sp. FL0933]|nr:hypothetical protein F5Y07DRAFT_22307 [Xylaria sp. FL0933]
MACHLVRRNMTALQVSVLLYTLTMCGVGLAPLTGGWRWESGGDVQGLSREPRIVSWGSRLIRIEFLRARGSFFSLEGTGLVASSLRLTTRHYRKRRRSALPMQMNKEKWLSRRLQSFRRHSHKGARFGHHLLFEPDQHVL